MKRKISTMLSLTLCVSLFAGCTKNKPQADDSSSQQDSAVNNESLLDNESFSYDISSITVPDTVHIVGLGEASHGAGELQQLKADVFKALVTNNQCHVFAIEGDFGGCAKVDEYIHGGEGSAEEVVGEIGFRIYRTQEMADLVQWMREYNETAKEGEDLHFVGFDMQRFDNNKVMLMAYLNEKAPDLAKDYESKFAELTDDTMYDLSDDVLTAAESDLNTLIATMKNEIAGSEQDSSFDFAMQCAQSMLENTQLQKNDAQYNTLRDVAMKNKVDWICDQYDGLIFINGHNGHIAKTSASGYECMGAQLDEAYADQYFAIGTDVKQCEFNGQDDDGYKVFTVENENDLTAQLNPIDKDFYYLDFAKVANNAGWQDILNKSQTMLALNVSFSAGWEQMKMAYTLSMVPAQSYDGMIILKTTTPTHFLN